VPRDSLTRPLKVTGRAPVILRWKLVLSLFRPSRDKSRDDFAIMMQACTIRFSVKSRRYQDKELKLLDFYS